MSWPIPVTTDPTSYVITFLFTTVFILLDNGSEINHF